MMEQLLKIIAALVCSCFFFVGTFKLLGGAQQAGYKASGLFRWLKRKGNTFYARLAVWATLLLFSAAITVLCFSFAGVEGALCLSSVPVFGFSLFFCFIDRKYALKVPVVLTGRVKRLGAVYYFITACVSYGVIALCAFVGDLVAAKSGCWLYPFVQYLPAALLPLLLPAFFLLAMLITAPFEQAHNRAFVRKASEKLAQTKMVRVGIVGSYGKTSVKQILTALLSQKYKVCATPASYNTPVGIAKTVTGESFDGAEVFVAEMGARKKGDIEELCQTVRPDYALFTGVCAQHVATFGSLEEVKREKCAILRSGAKKIVCASSLQEELKEETADLSQEERAAALYLDGSEIEGLQLYCDRTAFTLKVGGEEIAVSVPLLGKHSAENIALCAVLAYEMGLSVQEIEKGLATLAPVEHRLQLIRQNGIYILDDGYNANEKGAGEAIDALCRFTGKKIVVTPGLIETGILEKQLGQKLGEKLASADLDKIILIGETQIAPVKEGYLQSGGDKEKLALSPSLEKAKVLLTQELRAGDAVLFLNDLPDVY